MTEASMTEFPKRYESMNHYTYVQLYNPNSNEVGTLC